MCVICVCVYVCISMYIYINNFDTFHKHTKGLFLFLLLSSLLQLLILLSVLFLDRDTVKKMGYIFFHSWTVGLGENEQCSSMGGLIHKEWTRTANWGPPRCEGPTPPIWRRSWPVARDASIPTWKSHRDLCSCLFCKCSFYVYVYFCSSVGLKRGVTFCISLTLHDKHFT